MLDILGSTNRNYCDRVSRRSFLRAGALGLGFAGLGTADILRAEAAAGIGSSSKALINIHLGGGPSHQDMWDLKPDAPVEYRGEFSPIKTNVPGLHICEHFPKLATMADRFAVIRGLIGNVNEHSHRTAMTGYRKQNLEAVGGRPGIGSVIAKTCDGVDEQKAPPYVSLMGKVEAGYLGPIYSPYIPDGNGRANLTMSHVKADRLGSRNDLLSKLDGLRREADQTGKMDAFDAFSQRAVDVITSGKMADALDLNKEKPEVLKRYQGDGRGRRRDNKNFLLARRMIEAGVRCVAMRWGGWDTHSNNFKTLSDQLPALDMGLSALLDDLYDRRMLDDVTVIVWGEFGRTPRVNGNGGGRDHWPRVAAAWIAGGGIKAGQAVGESDRIAGDAVTPVHVHNVHATLYHNMGINTRTQQFHDPAGRPQYLLDHRDPVRELV